MIKPQSQTDNSLFQYQLNMSTYCNFNIRVIFHSQWKVTPFATENTEVIPHGRHPWRANPPTTSPQLALLNRAPILIFCDDGVLECFIDRKLSEPDVPLQPTIISLPAWNKMQNTPVLNKWTVLKNCVISSKYHWLTHRVSMQQRADSNQKTPRKYFWGKRARLIVKITPMQDLKWSFIQLKHSGYWLQLVQIPSLQ